VKTIPQRPLKALSIFFLALFIGLALMPPAQATNPRPVLETYGYSIGTNVSGQHAASVTIPDHLNRYLLAWVYSEADTPVSGVTYGGTPLTQVAYETTTNIGVRAFGLANPNNGSAVQLIYDFGVNTAGKVVVLWESFSNVDLGIGVDAYGFADVLHHNFGGSYNRPWSINTIHYYDFVTVTIGLENSACSDIASVGGGVNYYGNCERTSSYGALESDYLNASDPLSYGSTYGVTQTYPSSIIMAIALSPAGSTTGGSNGGITSTESVVNWILVFIVMATPAFVLYSASKGSVTLLILGFLIGASIAAGAGIAPQWLPFVVVLALAGYLIAGGDKKS